MADHRDMDRKGRGRRRTRHLGAALLLLIAVLLARTLGAPADPDVAEASRVVFEGPVPEAECGPGSSPETGLQGQVPWKDRESGRSREGYRCNMDLLGQYHGVGASWQFAWHGNCGYYDTHSDSAEGVAVIDARQPDSPTLTTKLVTPAMVGPWESLKANAKRGLLAGVAGYPPIGNGPPFFDVYDVGKDCTQPELLGSVPVNLPIGHEGNWAQDGMTYYATATFTPHISAIDVSDPTSPRLIALLEYGAFDNHGLATSADGNRLYVATESADCGNGMRGSGMQIVDVTDIQARREKPQTHPISAVCWEDGNLGQHPIPVTIKKEPYIIFVDEGGAKDEGGGPCRHTNPPNTSPIVNFTSCAGAARLIDISDETRPTVVSKFKLEIHLPTHAETAAKDTAGNGIFGYQAHYCNVDRLVEPTVLGCSEFDSGIRVFDIRNPLKPREIAYFIPPAQVGKSLQLRGSTHANPADGNANLTADWCTAQVRFVPERGELWTSCMDNGFLALKFTNGVWPFDDHREQGGPTSSSG